VSRVLYPYATKHLSTTVTSQWNDKDFAAYRAAFPEELQESPEAIINHCLQLASKDIKDPAWKQLQGLIWRQGYADGVLSVPLFSDVAPMIRQWYKEKYTLAIFSSGSVQAQKLFFAYVDPHANLSDEKDATTDTVRRSQPEDYTATIVANGPTYKKDAGPSGVSTKKTSLPEDSKTEDLNYIFSANFDTINAGPKTVSSSYQKIAEEMHVLPRTCLFISDNVKEVIAAKDAGYQAILVDRPGNAPLTEEDERSHNVITSLRQLKLDRPR